MPTTIVEETTVYSLKELEELFPSAYEDAINNIISQQWEWFEPSDITYDMKENIIGEDYKWFTLTDRTLEWSMSPTEVKAEGCVDVEQFMRETKLYLKYRSLYWAVTAGGLEKYATGRFGFGYYRNKDHVELADLERDIECYIDDPKRQAKMLEQLKIVEGEIDGHLDALHDRLRKLLHDTENDLSSEAYAKEEAEANDWRWQYTESGKLYWL